VDISKSCPCCESTDLIKSPAILMPFVAYRVFGWMPVEITDDWGLLTVKNGNAYTVCNSLQCVNCGFLFLDMRFNKDEVKSLYAGYGGLEYTKTRQCFEPQYQNGGCQGCSGSYVKDIEEFIRPHVEPRSILDWGGLAGENTPFKNNMVHIYDISNTPPVAGVLVDSPFGKYDLVVCSHVLEHVPYPEVVLHEIRKYIGEILYIELPLEDTSKAIEKKYWHEHINFFSIDSLYKLFKRCGLSIIDYKLSDGISGPRKKGFLYRMVLKCLDW
jgi:hypothetical protein